MTVSEFLNKYNGKGLDWDHYYGFQCVDLAQFYNKEVVGGTPLSGNAKDIWTTYPKAFYDRISNTPDGVPQRGDIVIWGTGVGVNGHIAVFYQGDIWNFTSFDQNWPVGSLCHFQPHNYTGVLGWLRPKTSPTTNPTPPQTPLTDAQKIQKIKDILNGPGSSDEKIDRVKAILN